MSKQRIFMLGLDSASLPFIKQHRDALPNLGDLLDGGSVRRLKSTAVEFPASVWPTFYSGMMPGEHGQYFPMQWDATSQRFRRTSQSVWAAQHYVEPFWHSIARSGKAVIAFDIGHVLNDERAPCLQITNWSYQSSGEASASNPQVLADIRQKFGHRPIGHEVPVAKTRKECIAIREQMTAAVNRKADAICWLMERPWDLFITAMYEVHRAGHNLWPVDEEFASDAEPDALLDVYIETDRQIGRIREKLDRVSGVEIGFALFSLHGLEPNRAQDHFLPEILNRLNAQFLGNPLAIDDKPHVSNTMAYLRRSLPPNLQYRLASALGENVQDFVVNYAFTRGKNWQQTPSFTMPSGGEGFVRLNIKGRERDGFFAADSRQLAEYIDWLSEKLSEITVEDTSEFLVEKTIKTTDVYPGSRSDFLPDLVIQWKPSRPAVAIQSPTIGTIREHLATGRGGNHTADAFLLASGPAWFREAVGGVKHIADLGQLANALSQTQMSAA